MYNTSSDYKNAMRANSRVDDLTGVIYFPDGGYQSLAPRDINVNTLKISKQCIDNDELMFGGCYIGVLDLEIRTNKSRYAFFGAVISLTYKVVVGEENNERVWEEVPLGTYTVAEAEKGSDDNYIKVTGYDNIQLLDIDWGDKSVYGTPWEILQEISTDTGLVLAFNEASLTAFPNYDELFQIDKDSGCSSYRDAVKIVAQLLGAFAQATRDGKLELRRFNTSSVMTLTKAHRYSIVVADYECHYISLFITGMKGTYHDETEDPMDFGLTMTIGDCPSFDYGTDETLARRTTNLFNYLESIRYTPVEIDMPGDPSFDCADRLSIGVGTDEVQTIITSYEWRFRDGMTITSKGINPYLVVSDQNARSARIQSKIIDANKLVAYDFTNLSDVELGDTESQEIAKCLLFPMQDTHVVFMATIRVHATVDDITTTTEEQLIVPITAKTQGGVVTPIYDEQGNPLTLTGNVTAHHTNTEPGKMSAKIWYTLDGDDMGYEAIDDLIDGDHIITVIYPFNVLSAQQRTWRIFMEAGGGTLSIERSTMQATIIGQNLIEGNAWGGIIEVSDELTLIGRGHATFGTLTESVGFVWYDVEDIECADVISLIGHGKATFGTMSDSIDIDVIKNVYNIVSEDKDYRLVSEDKQYNFESEGRQHEE